MNYGNHDDVVQQLTDGGLVIDKPLDVGRRQRWKVQDDRERRGWSHLHEMRLDDGRFVLVGSFGVWRGADPGSTKVTLAKGTAMTPEQRAALKARMATDRRAELAARQADADRAAVRAQAMWRRLAADGDCDYLHRKAVQAHGVRFTPQGAMAVPLLNAAGQVQGLQFILPAEHPRRKRLQRDKDFWPKGLAKQGHFFLIGNPAAADVCLVAEGYATAATLFEATGRPVAVAFDAGNVAPVAAALRQRYRRLRLLMCADDDYLGKCRECGELTLTAGTDCGHCGKPHRLGNAGVQGAHDAALLVDGHVLAPVFAQDRQTDQKGPTDFNDLAVLEGLHAVREQVEGRLSALEWAGARKTASPTTATTGDGDASDDMRSVESLGELMERFALVYEAGEAVFDGVEHKIVPMSAMRHLCAGRQLHKWWLESATKRVLRLEEVGFDPTERDERIKGNLWAGWPTKPRAGNCERLLELGEFLCSRDTGGPEMWRWLMRWLAYPIQHPGAKMKTAVIMHGGQGTGKNLFFEAVVRIYGRYGRMLNQDAVEDKFNDWASCLLFGVADEMVARDEMYHAKNKLKTLITSDSIRINPKNLASHYETNHANLVFLSNEAQPMALERDDRRYGVIFTPEKQDTGFYNAVLSEIREGGIEALHDHLLRLPLADFGPATLPPMTEAKRDLIEMGMDSSETFLVDWVSGALRLPVTTCRSEDLFEAYRHFCERQGVHRAASLKTFVGSISKRPGMVRERRQHFLHYSQSLVQSTVLVPPGAANPDDRKGVTDAINTFAEAVRRWKEESKPGKSGGTCGGEDGPF